MTTAPFLEAFVLEQIKDLIVADGGWIRAADVMARLPADAAIRPAHPGATLYQWVWERKLFAVTHHQTDYFPAFAMMFYPALQPLPVLSVILAEMGATDWAMAAWLSTPCAALDQRRPRDLILEFPDLVVAAAKQAVA